MNLRSLGKLLQQTVEDLTSPLAIAATRQRKAQCEHDFGIINSRVDQWTKLLAGSGIIVNKEVAQSQQHSHCAPVRLPCPGALERRNSFSKLLGLEPGESQVVVNIRDLAVPNDGLFKVPGGALEIGLAGRQKT